MSKTKDVGQGVDMPDGLIGYMSIVELSKDLFRGGLLLADLRGKPRDFRCTSAIKPNAIQRVLYGGTLYEHMALDLCGLPLLNALPKIPAVLLVDRPDLLALRAQNAIPLLWIRRQSEIQAPGRADMGGEIEMVASENGLFDTVLASCHADHADDLPGAVDFVRQIGQVLDPLESFGRIAAALKLVQDKAGPR